MLPTLDGPLEPPGRLSAVEPSPLPIAADPERALLAAAERVAPPPPVRDVAARMALPLRPPLELEPAAPTAVGSAEPEAELTVPEPAVPEAPLPLELLGVVAPELEPVEPLEERPLELPCDPRWPNEPEGPLRPAPLRLPRMSGVIIETYFSA